MPRGSAHRGINIMQYVPTSAAMIAVEVTVNLASLTEHPLPEPALPLNYGNSTGLSCLVSLLSYTIC